MTQDETIEMARELGLEHIREDVLKRFVKLVAEHEREACALIAQKTVCDTHIPTGVKIYGTVAAKAIRARGQQ